MMLLLPSLMMASPTVDNDVLIGKWISPEFGQILNIQDWRKGIKVRDSRSGRWIQYRRKSNRSFRSNAGREVRFLDYNTISFSEGHHRQRVIFKRRGAVLNSFECQTPHGHDGYYSSNSPYSSEYDYYDGYQDSNRNNRNGTNRDNRVKPALEGTYLNRELNHEFILLEDRNGIKTKIKGESKWYYYTKERNQNGVYTDRVGNVIRRTNLSNIEWNGINGRRYKLNKVSEKTF